MFTDENKHNRIIVTTDKHTVTFEGNGPYWFEIKHKTLKVWQQTRDHQRQRLVREVACIRSEYFLVRGEER